jgi:phage I-like protein
VPVLVAVGNDPALATSASLIALLAQATALMVPQDPVQVPEALNRALDEAGRHAKVKAKT